MEFKAKFWNTIINERKGKIYVNRNQVESFDQVFKGPNEKKRMEFGIKV